MDNKENIKFLVREIQNLFLSKKYLMIIKETKEAIKKYPKMSIFYNMLGLALSSIGKFNEAIVILKRGIEINKNDLAIINNLANAYKSNFNYLESENLYKLSISIDKNYVNSYVNYGNLKRDLNQFNEAIELYKKALNYNDKISGLNYALAMAYQSLGDFKNAENYAIKTINLDYRFTKADLLISRSKKYDPKDDHLLQMKNKLENKKLATNNKIELNFALAKAYEDLNDVNLSYDYLKKGNELKRSNIEFSIDIESKIFSDIEKLFSKVDFKKFSDIVDSSKKIIFILGMPRSGTTLTEQILSSHSKVYGAGELPYLPTIINDYFIKNKTFMEKKVNEFLEDPKYIKILSNKYFSYLSAYKISQNYVTDKAPLNFLWIGFIKVLFPNSKIIHCKRDARDNCFSLYKNFFEGNLDFSYKPDELAKYYNLYKNLMAFWKNKLPAKDLYDIEYEKLVSNPEIEIRKLLQHCEINWEDDCLNFSKNKTPIKTASVGQARKSIYSTSVKSYSKYSNYLKKFFENL